jgi:hypothetical protein
MGKRCTFSTSSFTTIVLCSVPTGADKMFMFTIRVEVRIQVRARARVRFEARVGLGDG